MKCQTHDADTVGIDAPNKPPSPARSTWLILAQFDPQHLVQESIIKQILPRNTAKAEVTSAGTTQLS